VESAIGVPGGVFGRKISLRIEQDGLVPSEDSRQTGEGTPHAVSLDCSLRNCEGLHKLKPPCYGWLGQQFVSRFGVAALSTKAPVPKACSTFWFPNAACASERSGRINTHPQIIHGHPAQLLTTKLLA
jgi:hypothetical protein